MLHYSLRRSILPNFLPSIEQTNQHHYKVKKLKHLWTTHLNFCCFSTFIPMQHLEEIFEDKKQIFLLYDIFLGITFLQLNEKINFIIKWKELKRLFYHLEEILDDKWGKLMEKQIFLLTKYKRLYLLCSQKNNFLNFSIYKKYWLYPLKKVCK